MMTNDEQARRLLVAIDAQKRLSELERAAAEHERAVKRAEAEFILKFNVMMWGSLIDTLRRSSRRAYENTGTMEA